MRVVWSRAMAPLGARVHHRLRQGVAAPRVAQLHATRVVYKGRRTGSKAHLPPVRKTTPKVAKPKKVHGVPGWRMVAKKRNQEQRQKLEDLGLLDAAKQRMRALLLSKDGKGETGGALPAKEPVLSLAFPGVKKSSQFLIREDLMPTLELSVEQQLNKCVASPNKREAYSVARVRFREIAAVGAPKEQAWLSLLRCASRAREFHDTYAIADAAYAAHPEVFSEPSVATNVVTALVQVAAQTRHVTHAWSTWHAAHESSIVYPAAQPEAYAAMIKCCAHQQLPERSFNLLEDMQRAEVPRSGETYSAMMEAVAEAPAWHQEYGFLSDELLDQMEGDSVRPTPQLYTALIKSAGRAGDPLAATVYWNEMVEKGFKPNAVTYTELFSALARCQSVGQKNGTKFRCIPKPPWEFIGHDPTKMMASSKQTKESKVQSMYKDLPELGEKVTRKSFARTRAASRASIISHKPYGGDDDVYHDDDEEGEEQLTEEDESDLSFLQAGLNDQDQDQAFSQQDESFHEFEEYDKEVEKEGEEGEEEDEEEEDEDAEAMDLGGRDMENDESEMSDEEINDFVKEMQKIKQEQNDAPLPEETEEEKRIYAMGMEMRRKEQERATHVKTGISSRSFMVEEEDEDEEVNLSDYDDAAADVDRSLGLPPEQPHEIAANKALRQNRDEDAYYDADGDSIEEARSFMEKGAVDEGFHDKEARKPSFAELAKREDNDLAYDGLEDVSTLAAVEYFRLNPWNVTRLRDLDYEEAMLKSKDAAMINKRQEANIASARQLYDEMCSTGMRIDTATLNAYLAVYTESMRLERAREVIEVQFPRHDVVPDDRTHRHVVIMLAKRGELEKSRGALDAMTKPDLESIGAVLDAHARFRDVDRSFELVDRLQAAHMSRQKDFVGAGSAPVKLPEFAADKIVEVGGPDPREPQLHPEWNRTRGPPERLLRMFRWMCREQKIEQPDFLPIDPMKWRQANAKDRQDPEGSKDIVRKRALLRRF